MVNSNIKVLDCTLRDGGYVNNFDFGEKNIHSIVKNLESSNVDLIELGFLKDGNHKSSQTLFNNPLEAEQYAQNPNQEYCLMIRPDWYDITQFGEGGNNIKNIRFAFHQKDLELTLKQASIVREAGYKVYFNPVNVLSYTEDELINILTSLNEFKPEGIYIVDTFGSIFPSDLDKLFSLFNSWVSSDIAIGLHLHENLSLSLSLAASFIEKIGTRKAYIDSSVLGMGRIPGNLCTELIMNFMNITQNSNFDLNSIYKIIDNPISQIKSTNPWGYTPAYAITGFNQIHRSYAEYFLNKPNLSLPEIDKLLMQVKAADKHVTFNETLASELYEISKK